jgi:competence protein ComEA
MQKIIRRFAGLAAALALVAVLAPALPAGADAGVNVNTATEEELVSLPGIGPSKAKAIVEYRQAHPFKTVDELMNVRGIGEHTFETLKDKVNVGAAATESAKQ